MKFSSQTTSDKSYQASTGTSYVGRHRVLSLGGLYYDVTLLYLDEFLIT